MSRRTARGLISSKGGNKVPITEAKSEGGSARYCSRHRCSASIHSARETQKEEPNIQSSSSSSQSRGPSKLFSTTDRRKPCRKEQYLNLHAAGTRVEETTNPQASDRQGLSLSAMHAEHDSIHGCRLKNKNLNRTRESSESGSLQGIRRTSNSASSSRSSSRQVTSQRKQDHRVSRPSIRRNSTSETSRQPATAASQDTESGSSRNGFGKFRHSVSRFLNGTVNAIGKRATNGQIFSATGKRTADSVSRRNAGSSDGSSSGSTPSRNQHSRTNFNFVRTRRAARRDVRMITEDSLDSSPRSDTNEQAIIPSGWDDSFPWNNTNEQRIITSGWDDSSPWNDTNEQPIIPSGWDDSSRWNGTNEHPIIPSGWSSEDPLPQTDMYPEEDEEQYWQERHHDRHRDMRMDIDDMSYEELLALGERIGIVSTALSEEVISNSLKRSNYSTECLVSGDDDNEEDGIKCSICQMEYVVGEELGELACQHSYHPACIQQWLQHKNWCPICKATVSATS